MTGTKKKVSGKMIKSPQESCFPREEGYNEKKHQPSIFARHKRHHGKPCQPSNTKFQLLVIHEILNSCSIPTPVIIT